MSRYGFRPWFHAPPPGAPQYGSPLAVDVVPRPAKRLKLRPYRFFSHAHSGMSSLHYSILTAGILVSCMVVFSLSVISPTHHRVRTPVMNALTEKMFAFQVSFVLL